MTTRSFSTLSDQPLGVVFKSKPSKRMSKRFPLLPVPGLLLAVVLFIAAPGFLLAQFPMPNAKSLEDAEPAQIHGWCQSIAGWITKASPWIRKPGLESSRWFGGSPGLNIQRSMSWRGTRSTCLWRPALKASLCCYRSLSFAGHLRLDHWLRRRAAGIQSGRGFPVSSTIPTLASPTPKIHRLIPLAP